MISTLVLLTMLKTSENCRSGFYKLRERNGGTWRRVEDLWLLKIWQLYSVFDSKHNDMGGEIRFNEHMVKNFTNWNRIGKGPWSEYSD